MMPVVFRVPEWVPLLGAQPVTSFGVMLLVAILAGGWWLVRGLDRSGVPRSSGWDLVVVAAIGGLAGAKLLHVALHPAVLADGPGALLARTGLDGMGALLGALAAGGWRGRSRGIALPKAADAAAPALALAYGIGRIGSFLAGTEYGRPTSSILGVAFRRGAPPTTPSNLAEEFGVLAPPGTMVGDHVLVHPTQLYEAAFAFVLFAILVRWGPRAGFARLGVFLALAGTGRFAVEFLRIASERWAGPFTAEQLVAVLLAAAGVVMARTRDQNTDVTC